MGAVFDAIGGLFGGGNTADVSIPTVNPSTVAVSNKDTTLANDNIASTKRKRAGSSSLNTADDTIVGAASAGDKRTTSGPNG